MAAGPWTIVVMSRLALLVRVLAVVVVVVSGGEPVLVLTRSGFAGLIMASWPLKMTMNFCGGRAVERVQSNKSFPINGTRLNASHS